MLHIKSIHRCCIEKVYIDETLAFIDWEYIDETIRFTDKVYIDAAYIKYT